MIVPHAYLAIVVAQDEVDEINSEFAGLYALLIEASCMCMIERGNTIEQVNWYAEEIVPLLFDAWREALVAPLELMCFGAEAASVVVPPMGQVQGHGRGWRLGVAHDDPA